MTTVTITGPTTATVAMTGEEFDVRELGARTFVWELTAGGKWLTVIEHSAAWETVVAAYGEARRQEREEHWADVAAANAAFSAQIDAARRAAGLA